MESVLRGNRWIRELCFRDCKIGNRRLRVLLDCLAEDEVLEVLDLSLNRFNDDGMKVLSSFIEKNQSLTAISIERTRVRGRGILRLVRSMSRTDRLQSLNIRDLEIDWGAMSHLLKFMSMTKTMERIDYNWGSIIRLGKGPDIYNTLLNSKTICYGTHLQKPLKFRRVLLRNRYRVQVWKKVFFIFSMRRTGLLDSTLLEHEMLGIIFSYWWKQCERGEPLKDIPLYSN